MAAKFSLSVAKITFGVGEITFKVTVVTSFVAKYSLLVAKITFPVSKIIIKEDHFLNDQYISCDIDWAITQYTFFEDIFQETRWQFLDQCLTWQWLRIILRKLLEKVIVTQKVFTDMAISYRYTVLVMIVNLGQNSEMNGMTTPCTGFEIRALTVWRRARHLSVTEATPQWWIFTSERGRIILFLWNLIS